MKPFIKKISLKILFTFTFFIFMFITMALMIIGTHILNHVFHIGNLTGPAPRTSFIVASILVGTLVSFAFSKFPMHPIETLIRAIDNLAKGDFSSRIYLNGPDVFKKLTMSFNHMAQELESTEMLRSDFINNFSHEFKTPIGSIRGFAKELKNEDLSDAQRTEYLDIIISESERLSELSTNILNLSKLEHQRILTDETTFNLTEQIRLVIALLGNRWDKKDLQIAFESDEIQVYANEEMMKQVWINVLSNSIKFAPNGSTITIKLESHPTHTQVRISNQGDAIPLRLWNKIFEKFYQSDASRATDGNGLGLPLARRIMDLHQGKIYVKESSSERTTFEVQIPKQI